MPPHSFNRPDGLTPAQWWAWEQRRQLAEQHLAGATAAADSSQLRRWQHYVAGDQLPLPAAALLPGARSRQQLTQALYASPSSLCL